MKLLGIAAACITMAALAFTSCEKTDNTPLVQSIESDDEVASYFDELLGEMDELTFQSPNTKSEVEYKAENSGTRTIVTSFSGDTVIHTITYAEFVNGNTQFERIKNGVMIVKVVGRPLMGTFWRQISFDNFTVNGHTIEGVKEVAKTGEYQFTITLTGGKITFTDGIAYTRDFEHIRTWIAGYETPFFIWDDEFAIEGNATGVNRQEQNYSRIITSPLIAKRGCRWITSGIIDVEVGDKNATLDYGDGECDRFATITVDGESWTINLR
ncbi:MAG: hypothetical protein RBT74_07790 [Tenuifilaceae bacterium]|jgi:hypothetical protein|nr:hypothetical protein [Tenuifilaceae bacterium]